MYRNKASQAIVLKPIEKIQALVPLEKKQPSHCACYQNNLAFTVLLIKMLVSLEVTGPVLDVILASIKQKKHLLVSIVHGKFWNEMFILSNFEEK